MGCSGVSKRYKVARTRVDTEVRAMAQARRMSESTSGTGEIRSDMNRGRNDGTDKGNEGMNSLLSPAGAVTE